MLWGSDGALPGGVLARLPPPPEPNLCRPSFLWLPAIPGEARRGRACSGRRGCRGPSGQDRPNGEQARELARWPSGRGIPQGMKGQWGGRGAGQQGAGPGMPGMCTQGGLQKEDLAFLCKGQGRPSSLQGEGSRPPGGGAKSKASASAPSRLLLSQARSPPCPQEGSGPQQSSPCPVPAPWTGGPGIWGGSYLKVGATQPLSHCRPCRAAGSEQMEENTSPKG